jgi:metal-responsive CopG/Arc/MetJ family transcriptional regulator
MAKKDVEPADGDAAKVVIYSRIDPKMVEGLDEIRETMRPKPSRAQLIDLAVAEYVEKHKPKGKGK